MRGLPQHESLKQLKGSSDPENDGSTDLRAVEA